MNFRTSDNAGIIRDSFALVKVYQFFITIQKRILSMKASIARYRNWFLSKLVLYLKKRSLKKQQQICHCEQFITISPQVSIHAFGGNVDPNPGEYCAQANRIYYLTISFSLSMSLTTHHKAYAS